MFTGGWIHVFGKTVFVFNPDQDCLWVVQVQIHSILMHPCIRKCRFAKRYWRNTQQAHILCCNTCLFWPLETWCWHEGVCNGCIHRRFGECKKNVGIYLISNDEFLWDVSSLKARIPTPMKGYWMWQIVTGHLFLFQTFWCRHAIENELYLMRPDNSKHCSSTIDLKVSRWTWWSRVKWCAQSCHWTLWKGPIATGQ